MKLSFSIPSSKSKTKPTKTPHGEEEADNRPREFVTEFDPTKPPTDSDRRKPLVIPPIQNEWRPTKRMKNLDLPLQPDAADTDIRFEVETLSASAAANGDGKISYGLNLRESNSDAASAATDRPKTEDLLLDKLRDDLKRLPEDPGFEEYEDVPVEGFGAALLAGYGWYEGRGIGRNAKGDVKVKEYTRRTDKEGLGFVVESRGGRDRERNEEKSRDRDRESKVRHRDGSDDDGFFVGKDVRVIGGGRDVVGLKGTILKKLGRDQVVLRLGRTDEEIKVRVVDIADLGSKEEEKCLKKLKELKLGEASKTRNRGKRDYGQKTERRDSVKRDRENSEVKADLERGVEWLRRHIRVRIVSKDLKGGRLYLKKGEVVDVVGPYKCDVSMDESRELVQGVDQDFLETALPRRGGPVLVLYGKHEGLYGNLVERDSGQEIGVVQDSDTQELVNVKLDQIAEYIGDPSYLGY